MLTFLLHTSNLLQFHAVFKHIEDSLRKPSTTPWNSTVAYKCNSTCGSSSHHIHTCSIPKAAPYLQDTPFPPLSLFQHRSTRQQEHRWGRSELAPVTTAALSRTDSTGSSNSAHTLLPSEPAPLPRAQHSMAMGWGQLTGEYLWVPPDFAFILPIEKVLAAHPFSHHKLQGGFASGAGQAAQEFQQWLQLWVNQVSKHHDQGLQERRKAMLALHNLTAGNVLSNI